MKRTIAIAVALLSVLAGCTSPTSTPDATATAPSSGASSRGAVWEPLVVGLTYTPNIQFAPFYVALQKQYFDDEGLDVRLRHHGGSEPLLGALKAGTEDVVYAGGDEMMQARSQGTKVVDFATFYQSYPVVLITREDSQIHTATDLKGRSVGVPGPYGETWFALLAMLKGAGLTQSDVNIVNIGYTQQAALSTRKVDAVMGYVNNDAVLFTAAGIPVRSIPISDNPPLVGVGLGASDDTMTNRRDELQALLRALTRAVADIEADPATAVQLSTSQVPGLESKEQADAALATLRATIPLFGDIGSLGAQNDQRWTEMSTFLDEMGLLASPVSPGDAYVSLGAQPDQSR